MAAHPITPDPYIANTARNLAELNAELSKSSGLSPQEIAFLPEAKARPWKPKGLPVTEIDCELKIPGQGEVAVTLAVWGTFTRAFHSRDREEPDEPAGFVVDAVMMGDVDVTGELGWKGEAAIASYVMENCEEDTPPEPEPRFCEDRR